MNEKKARKIVRERANNQCERCGGPGQDYSHRISRRVKSQMWNPANALLLCRPCHTWCHANPTKAFADGLQLQTYRVPELEPFRSISGWWILDSEGGKRDTNGLPARP